MQPWVPSTAGVVELPSGRRVRCRALRAAPAADAPAVLGSGQTGQVPDLGLYLTARPHRERWPSRWIAWPDFLLPRDRGEALAALREAHSRSARERVEIACGGGVGRTGTALAILARHDGVPADEAVAWVRATYHPRAVETPWQRRFARRARLSPDPLAPERT
ncbi:protein-tyrosine phosphatase family protein [Nocardioides zeae]|uniref:Protein-tyrosine phosphatase family protein n=1 Tax=Nocardioides imazamoxiresistens TaxID=3231893 RepID=A0ABU3PZM4_9ACTN|nr:protein-tyrosine phosphatase family protein [Nocardioides zeae]MDT9594599.1 protein-tyrosine phosphatase family protein [Nocardioides zeae]